MNAEILAVGSELLLGQITNTNARFISNQLSELGINVYYQIKTWTQIMAIAAALLHNTIFTLIGIPFDDIMLYIALFFTLWSGWDYFYLNRRVLLESK